MDDQLDRQSAPSTKRQALRRGLIPPALLMMSAMLAAEDQQPIPPSTSPEAELAGLRARLEVLEKQVSDLREQPSTPAATTPDSGLEDRVWGLEADQLTDSSVAFGGSGGVAVTARNTVGTSVEAAFDPIILYSFRQELLFVGELNATQDGIALGQAYMAYTSLPHLVVEVGLFPIPFAAYSERMSPPWINRMATLAPPIYNDEYGVFGGDQSAIGLQVRGDLEFAGTMRGSYHLFVTDSPSYNNPDDP